MKRPLYHAALRRLDVWEPFLLENSGLPGPRGNIELAQAVADEADPDRLLAYAAITPQQAPVNDPLEFLAFCGVIGLGRLLVEGSRDTLPALRSLATDPRWRVREGVCMALQRLGDRDVDRLLRELEPWVVGTPFEQRAAIATLCEPRLLRNPRHARATLSVLDTVTGAYAKAYDRKGEGYRALKKALGYCWSVAVVSFPEDGRPLFEKWFASDDPDITWIMRENLSKARLLRADAQWVLEMKRAHQA